VFLRNFDYNSVHVAGAERIASVAAKSGITRFVHVSHLNASQDSKSKFYQSKAEGEERVKSAFPNATIIRPAAMFGYEDKLLNNIAGTLFFLFSLGRYSVLHTCSMKVWPIWWKLNHGETKIRPVHVCFAIPVLFCPVLT
jgi:NADH dehydrogenase (ubiquinone) 1 alpha subcomplex subunit 9